MCKLLADSFLFYGHFLLCFQHDWFLKTNDYCAIPQQLKDQLSERYPGARRAYLKSGGDFPFLSRPDEVNLHLQVVFMCFCIQVFNSVTFGLLDDCIS